MDIRWGDSSAGVIKGGREVVTIKYAGGLISLDSMPAEEIDSLMFGLEQIKFLLSTRKKRIVEPGELVVVSRGNTFQKAKLISIGTECSMIEVGKELINIRNDMYW